MAMLDPKLVAEMKNQVCKIESIVVGNMIGFKGPWIDGVYESFSEALRENQKELARRQQKEKGLTETWQTTEQAKAFEKRKKLALEKQKKAELAAEMALQNK